MNFQRGKQNDEPEINLVPMIDVLLVILIFLVVTTTYSKFAELELTLPQTSAEQVDQNIEKPNRIDITVSALGEYTINLVPVKFSVGMSPVWFLLLIIESLGLIIKPAALAIRLFANMFAGHTVLLVFLSLGYILIANAAEATFTAAALGGFGWLLAVAFHAMELLVAFIQAYVFTLLAALFIGMSIHPEH